MLVKNNQSQPSFQARTIIRVKPLANDKEEFNAMRNVAHKLRNLCFQKLFEPEHKANAGNFPDFYRNNRFDFFDVYHPNSGEAEKKSPYTRFFVSVGDKKSFEKGDTFVEKYLHEQDPHAEIEGVGFENTFSVFHDKLINFFEKTGEGLSKVREIVIDSAKPVKEQVEVVLKPEENIFDIVKKKQ